MSGEFRLSSWVVQPSQNTVSRDGKTIHLEPKMVEVLVHLAEHPGETISKEQLIHAVWGDTFVTDDVLTRSISELRKALDDDAKEPRVIQTIPRKGYRLVPRVEPIAPAKKKRLWRYLIAFAVFCVALGTAIAYVHFRPVQPPIHSLAVLPLKNLSGDPGQQYVADALTDALITELGKINALRVISFQSVAHYRDSAEPVPQIAHELNVQALVEGSVTRQGDQIGINVQLVRANPEGHMWSHAYTRELSNVVVLQQEVARAVARNIEISVTPAEQARLGNARPVNPKAHESYLRGRYFLQKLSDEVYSSTTKRSATSNCINSFQEVVALDPNYAPAYAGLARCYAWAAGLVSLPENEAAQKMRAIAVKALNLDDGLAEAHDVLAEYEMTYAWDWTGSEQEVKRALELDPNSSIAHSSYAQLLLLLGHFDRALEEQRRARELDPLSLNYATGIGWIFLYSHRYDQALNQFRKVLEMDPNYRQARTGVCRAYELKGMYEKMLAEAFPNRLPGLKGLAAHYQKIYDSLVLRALRTAGLRGLTN